MKAFHPRMVAGGPVRNVSRLAAEGITRGCCGQANRSVSTRTAFLAGTCSRSASSALRGLDRRYSIPKPAPGETRLPVTAASARSFAATHPSTTRMTHFSTAAAPAAASEPTIHDVFETVTGTWQYVVADPATGKAVLIDPVLDYDPATQVVKTNSADGLLALVKEKGYTVERILETHAHADHLTAASYMQSRLAKVQGAKPPICIGKRIRLVQNLFSARYGVPTEEYEGVFDCLFEDDEIFKVGELEAKAIHLPGHTPDHLGYQIGDNVFCGDSVFHHDIGTARCDFPGGSETDLYASGQKLFSLGDEVKIWPGHDYPPAQRKKAISSATVGDHRMQNKHLKDGITEDVFVAMRKERDETLGAPRLLHQSLQMNIRAGRLPKPLGGRHRLLHLPLKLNGIEW